MTRIVETTRIAEAPDALWKDIGPFGAWRYCGFQGRRRRNNGPVWNLAARWTTCGLGHRLRQCVELRIGSVFRGLTS